MSTNWPMFQIFLGAVIVAFGAFITQRGWNEHGDTLERIATVSSLSDSIEANRKVLAFTARSTEKYKTPSVITKSAFPQTETTVLERAISRGVFLDGKYEQLRTQMRKTYTAWSYYNQSSSGSLVNPEKVKEDTAWAQKESETLAQILIAGFGQDQLKPEKETE